MVSSCGIILTKNILYFFSQQVKLSVPNFPQDPSKGSHEIAFEKTIFIEQTDFKEVRLMLTKISVFQLKVMIHVTLKCSDLH